jgi:hypothetical protein
MQIVEQGRGRLVLFIPAGGSGANGLGCFAIVWNGFMTLFTSFMLFGAAQQNAPPWPMWAFVGLFWAIGLTLIYFAIKMKYERLLLLVEPSRAVLQRTLFSRVRTEEADLAEGSAASLVKSYEQNDVPVYAVAIAGVQREIRFGTQLSDPEKNWITKRVNAVLGVKGQDDDEFDEMPAMVFRYPEQCAQCGGSLGSSAEANSQHELTCPFCGHVHRGEMVAIEPSFSEAAEATVVAPTGPFPADQVDLIDQTPDRLVFATRIAQSPSSRLGAGLFLGVFALIWNVITFSFVVGTLFAPGFFKIFALLFSIPFIGIGLVVAGAALFTLFGRQRVTVDRERLTSKWIAGPLHYTRSFPTSDIDRVTVQYSPWQTTQRGRKRSAELPRKLAIVWAGSRWMPLQALPNEHVALHLRKLVTDQFQAMDLRLDGHATPSPASINAGSTEE